MMMSNRITWKKVSNTSARAAEKIGDALFPPRCIACHNAIDHQHSFLCPACFNAIELNTALYCPLCMGRIGNLHQPCHRATGYMLAPATFYRDPIPALIHHFKYQKMTGIGLLASALLISYLKNLDLPLDRYLFVPIPLHPSRQRERGFNQALLLAQSCAAYFQRPLACALVRTAKTEQQASLSTIQQRHKNVARAFALDSSVSVRGKTVILIDDVSTSGATLGAAARALIDGGARKIIGAVIAKAQ